MSALRLDGTTTPKGEYVNRVLKAGASLIATTALAATAFAATSVPAQSASACQLNFRSYGSVSAGSTGVLATAAECLLSSAGYSVKINGSFTAAEAAAAAKFKSAKKLPGGAGSTREPGRRCSRVAAPRSSTRARRARPSPGCSAR